MSEITLKDKKAKKVLLNIFQKGSISKCNILTKEVECHNSGNFKTNIFDTITLYPNKNSIGKIAIYQKGYIKGSNLFIIPSHGGPLSFIPLNSEIMEYIGFDECETYIVYLKIKYDKEFLSQINQCKCYIQNNNEIDYILNLNLYLKNNCDSIFVYPALHQLHKPYKEFSLLNSKVKFHTFTHYGVELLKLDGYIRIIDDGKQKIGYVEFYYEYIYSIAIGDMALARYNPKLEDKYPITLIAFIKNENNPYTFPTHFAKSAKIYKSDEFDLAKNSIKNINQRIMYGRIDSIESGFLRIEIIMRNDYYWYYTNDYPTNHEFNIDEFVIVVLEF